MLDKKGDVKTISSLLKDATNSDFKPNNSSTQNKYEKADALGAVEILVNNNKELRNELDEKGEQNMDTKDMEILNNKIEKMLAEKLEKKFDGLENDLNAIKEANEKTCANGDCFADKLDVLDKKIDEFGDVKTSVFDLKLDVNEKIKGITESISNIDKGLEDSISGINKGFEDSISTLNKGFEDSFTGMNAKLDDTCTGIECLTKRFAEDDDMVECPKCQHMFSLSANIVSDTVVCPNCGSISKLE